MRRTARLARFRCPIALLVASAACAQTTLRGPVPHEPTALEVEAESTDVDCVGSSDEMVCAFDLRTRVGNPREQVEAAEVTLEASRSAEVRVTVDGAPAAERLTGGRVGVTLAVPPGGSREVRMQADATLDARPPRFSESPLRARHPLLGEEPRETSARVQICPAARGPWHAAEATTVRVIGPSRWDLDDAPRSRVGPDGTVVFDDVRTCLDLRWHPERRPIPVYHGGPLVGLGPTFGEGLRGRLGYEAGIDDWVISSLLIESDFDGELIVAPVVEAAMPAFVVIPSVSVGLGAPIRVRPERSAGVRGQLTMMWLAGPALSVDYFPDDDDWRTTLMLQVGL